MRLAPEPILLAEVPFRDTPPCKCRALNLLALAVSLVLVARPVVALPLAIGIPRMLDTSTLDPRLLAYGLYASQTLKLNDGVQIRPWRMGTGGDLLMGVGTVAYAYTFAVGNAGWGRSSVIQGDLRLGGTFGAKASDGAWIHGAVIRDTTLKPMRLRFPSSGMPPIQSLFVESRDSVLLDASTGNYPSDVTVRSGGKLVLRGGAFLLRSLVLNPGAKVYFQTLADSASIGGAKDSAVYVQVDGELLVDGAIMVGEAHTDGARKARPDGRSILWVYCGTQELHLNGTSRFLGALMAPNAKVSLASSAGFQGSLWAKEVEIHQYNGNLRFLPYMADSRTSDKDRDGLDDTLEFRIGTDPFLQDTDGDGYSDALEYRGRGASGLMGARTGVTQASPGFAHSWGWALDSTRRDLFNPLRRDQFLRLLWQDSSEIHRMISPMPVEVRRDPGESTCTQQPKYESLTWAEYDSAWSDSAYLDRLVELFADPSDKPLVNQPYSARVPDYTVVLHLDAGPTSWRNLPTGMPRLGGNRIIASGGLNTGWGPYDFDLNGDGRLDAGSPSWIEIDCAGNAFPSPLPDERTALLQKLFTGWSSDPYRDSWVVAIGFGSNGRDVVDQSIASGHIFVSAQTAQNVWGLRAVLLHEYGYTFGLAHFSNVSGLVCEGVMCNAAIGGSFQRCNQTRGATWNDTRSCGPEPSTGADGHWQNRAMGDANPWMNVTWARNGNVGHVDWNVQTSLSDTVLYEDGGPVDRRTGFRKVRAQRTLQDIRFSPGENCDLRVDSLLEYEGISICRNRRGELLPTRIVGTPIDWNQNGVIDLQPVNLWGGGGQASVPWFMYFSATGGAPAFLYPRQTDRNDWAQWIQQPPFIGADEQRNKKNSPFLIGEVPLMRDLKRIVSW